MPGNKVYVQGSYIDVHDNQNVYLSVDKAEVTVNDKVQQAAADTPTGADDEQRQIVEKLKPIFFGIEDEARAFLTSIQGMKPTQVTELVNQAVREGKLSRLSCHRDLWKVLYDCGIYDKTESNWNSQVG